MLRLLLLAALVAAVAAWGWRRLRRARLRRAARTRLGSSAERAIYIRSYGEIDFALTRRWCACGGYLTRLGEGTREEAGRRFRIARLRCQECEEEELVFFETTDVAH
jgi:hypothetical protein